MSAPSLAATRQKPGPKADPHRFPCGHARSAANSLGRKYSECLTCHRARSAEYNRNQRAVHAAVKPRTGRPAPRAPKPIIRLSQSPTYLRLMAEAKAEFARQISASRWKPGRRAS